MKLSYSKNFRYFVIVLICFFTVLSVAGVGIYAFNYIEKKDAQRHAEFVESGSHPDEDHSNEILSITDAIVLNSNNKIYYYETKKGFVPVEDLVVCVPDKDDDPEYFSYHLSTVGGTARYVKEADKSQTLDTVKLENVMAVGVAQDEYFALNVPYIDKHARVEDYCTDYVYYTRKIESSDVITAEAALSETEIVPENVVDEEAFVSSILPESQMDLPMGIASAILVVLLGIFVLVSAGHFGTEEIELTFYDKVGYFVHFAVMAAIAGICWVPYLLVVDRMGWKENLEYFIPCLFFGCIVTMLCGGWFLETTVVRIKAKKFWETTTCYYIYRFIKEPVVRFAEWIKENALSKKDEYNGVDKIIAQSSDIVSGKRAAIETSGIDPHYLTLAHSINAIASGKSNAVSAQMKSEKMRTELITNVSHDIKTPLTSIISYVDLLSKEELENAKSREYVEVIQRQSLRLKTLLEDLIEASKASSGVLSVNKESINIGVIINQVCGEYEERFAAKRLSVVSRIPEDTKPVMTDGRHLSRVIGNLFSNITKYALEGTRVYVDVVQTDRTIVTIKNTSASQLNISSDELMERFVRGDDSRRTEGSGLGLSIAGSLMKLMDGNLEIEIDGDLFKAIITI